MSSVEPEVEEAPTTEAEDPYRPVLDALKTELGDGFVESHSQRGDLWVRVQAGSWKRTGEVLRHHLGFDYFCFLSAIDWMPHTWPNPKVEDGESADGEGDGETAEEAADEAQEPAPADTGLQTGYAGGESRFQLLARVYSTTSHLGILLKADLDEPGPQVQTWSDVYRGADWHERETWEMYGILFLGHPNPVHLYLPGEFEGFPLRKDFPLLSREVKPWPGLVDVEPFPPGTEGEEAATDGDAADASAGEEAG